MGENFGLIVALLGIILALLGFIATWFPKSIRNKAHEEASEAWEKTATALRAELTDTERRCDDRITGYKSEVDVLKGRVTVLEDQFADRIAQKVADKLGWRASHD